MLNKKVYEFYKKRNELVKKVQGVCRRFIFTAKVSRKIKVISSLKKLFMICPLLLDRSRKNLKK